MENAGAGAARIALDRGGGPSASFACFCGPGQNGGDGLVVARHVAIAGGAVRIVLLAGSGGDQPPGDAGTNLRICRAMGLPIRVVRSPADACAAISWAAACGVHVDGLFGTGLARALEGAAAELALGMGGGGRFVLALDLPSGLDCDTGLPLGPCVRADATATFAAMKLGFANPSSREWTGDVVVVGIGAPVDEADATL